MHSKVSTLILVFLSSITEDFLVSQAIHFTL